MPPGPSVHFGLRQCDPPSPCARQGRSLPPPQPPPSLQLLPRPFCLFHLVIPTLSLARPQISVGYFPQLSPLMVSSRHMALNKPRNSDSQTCSLDLSPAPSCRCAGLFNISAWCGLLSPLPKLRPVRSSQGSRGTHLFPSQATQGSPVTLPPSHSSLSPLQGILLAPPPPKSALPSSLFSVRCILGGLWQ